MNAPASRVPRTFETLCFDVMVLIISSTPESGLTSSLDGGVGWGSTVFKYHPPAVGGVAD